MRVLIIEPHASGHHASYLKWLAQACRREGWRVAISTTRPVLAHPLVASLVSEGDGGIEFHVMPDSTMAARTSGGAMSLLRREFGYWRAFKRAAREVSATAPVDAVILPYLDYCYYAIGVLGAPLAGLPWCAISMRLSVERSGEGERPRIPWKWRIAGRMLANRSCKSLFIINPSVRQMPPEWFPAEAARKLHYLPDPAELPAVGARSEASARSEARAALGVPASALAILVFGSISERKGVDLLLAALASAEDLRDCVVVLAGSLSEAVSTLMRAPAQLRLQAEGRLLALDRYLDEVEQARAFAASDVVWVGYRDHPYMSGVLVLAGMAGLPALGTPRGEIGRLIGDNGLGAVARSEGPVEVARALRTLLDTEARIAAGRRSREFFSGHTVESFGRAVVSAIEPEQH